MKLSGVQETLKADSFIILIVWTQVEVNPQASVAVQVLVKKPVQLLRLELSSTKVKVSSLSLVQSSVALGIGKSISFLVVAAVNKWQ